MLFCIAVSEYVIDPQGRYPIAVISVALRRNSYDINVTPDKFTIMLHNEAAVLSAVRGALGIAFPLACLGDAHSQKESIAAEGEASGHDLAEVDGNNGGDSGGGGVGVDVDDNNDDNGNGDAAAAAAAASAEPVHQKAGEKGGHDVDNVVDDDADGRIEETDDHALNRHHHHHHHQDAAVKSKKPPRPYHYEERELVIPGVTPKPFSRDQSGGDGGDDHEKEEMQQGFAPVKSAMALKRPSLARKPGIFKEVM